MEAPSPSGLDLFDIDRWSPLCAIKMPSEGEEAAIAPYETVSPAYTLSVANEAQSVFTDCSLQVEFCKFADHLYSDQFNVASTLKWVEFSVALKNSEGEVVSPKLVIPLIASLEYENGAPVPIAGIMGNLVGETTATLHNGRCKFKVKPMTGITSALHQNRSFRFVVQPSDPALHCWSLKASSPEFRIMVKTGRRDANGQIKGPKIPTGLPALEPSSPKPMGTPSLPKPQEDFVVSEINEIVQRGAKEITSIVSGVLRRLGIAESSLKTLKKENAALVEEVAKLRNTIAAGSNAPVVGEASPPRKRTRAAR